MPLVITLTTHKVQLMFAGPSRLFSNYRSRGLFTFVIYLLTYSGAAYWRELAGNIDYQ